MTQTDSSADSRGLLGPAEIRELAEKIGVTPTKKLGQNFVHDPNTVRKIVRLAGVTDTDHVLEVGPGLGSLTFGLTEVGAEVTVVEIDERLAQQLPRTQRALQPDANLRVIHIDALDLQAHDIESFDRPNVLVANLPYNVSVPILMHLLELIPELERGLVMVQAEVGHRIAAGPGSKEYGSPSAKAAWYGEWSIAGNVSRKIFWPVPGVDSVLVGYVKHEDPLGTEQERKKTFSLINAAFGARRKMIRQSLQQAIPGFTTESISELVGRAGVSPEARAEELSVSDFLNIARLLV